MFLLAVWKHLGPNLYPQERRKQLEMPGLLQRLASLGSGRGGTLTRSHNRYYYTTILNYNITPVHPIPYNTLLNLYMHIVPQVRHRPARPVL